MNDKITNDLERAINAFKNKLIAQKDRIKYLEKEKENCVCINLEDVYKCKTTLDYQVLILKQMKKMKKDEL